MPSTTERERDALDALADAAAALDDAEAAVAAVGEADAERVADALEEARTLLARYRGSATGTGDFGAYVEFQERVSDLVEGLPADLPRRDAFEAFEAALEKRRLGERDFERAREALEPADEVVERLATREDARERYRRARRDARERLAAVEERIEVLERVRELGAADLDAPVERLRGPIDAYDEAVSTAFREFAQSAATREVLAVAASAASRPLVDFREPPDELVSYVEAADVGAEPPATLLEYADYSRSKLDHYVDDPGALKRAVASNRTYLARLDAEPLTVGWPPPERVALRMRIREVESVLRRFAGEETVAACREVRRLTRRDDYADLREAAVAREELSDEQRRRLADGAVERDLRDLRERRGELRAALDEHADP